MDHASTHAKQAAVAREGGLEIPILIALLNGAEEMLAPVLDPFHRPPQLEAGGGDHDLLGIHDKFGPKAAADIGRDHAHLVFVEAQKGHQESPHLVRQLRRCPQRQPILV